MAFLRGNLVSAGAAAEHGAVAHGVGQILADLAAAGIHLERREHQPAANLLTAARTAARINGRPALQTMVDTWIARLTIAQGDRAGALASLAQARLALTAPTTGAGHSPRSRSFASRSPWRQPKQAR